MSYRLSLLDKSPLAEHDTAQDALARTIELARQAEAWGFHRFWIAEHHNTPQLASPSPEIIIAWIVGQTRHIRVGSGGVMLQHYSPYKVAENFNVLASLAPGRIDIGIGKAPGGLPLSTQALQRGLHKEEKGSFAEQLRELDGWLKTSPDNNDAESLCATPVPTVVAERFLLGASVESASLAATLDWNFVFAAHLNGDKALLRDVVSHWRRESQRELIVAVQVIVAETESEAEQLARQVEIWGVELKNGQRVSVSSEAQAQAFARQAGSPALRIYRREPSLIKGTAKRVLAGLDALAEEFGVDEFVLDNPLVESPARITSLRLLAEAWTQTSRIQEVAE
jgi:luciferase family oxidoreductase group 1